jgi:hypothetical protein
MAGGEDFLEVAPGLLVWAREAIHHLQGAVPWPDHVLPPERL